MNMVHNPKQQLNNFGSRIHACKMKFLRVGPTYKGRSEAEVQKIQE